MEEMGEKRSQENEITEIKRNSETAATPKEVGENEGQEDDNVGESLNNVQNQLLENNPEEANVSLGKEINFFDIPVITQEEVGEKGNKGNGSTEIGSNSETAAISKEVGENESREDDSVGEVLEIENNPEKANVSLDKEINFFDIPVISQEDYELLLANPNVNVNELILSKEERGRGEVLPISSLEKETVLQKPVEKNTSKKISLKKEHYCFFCEEKIDRVTNHIRYHHHNEPLVQAIHKEKPNNRKRKEMISRLRKLGDYRRFEKLARIGIDEKVVVRKCMKSGQALKLCPNCNGFFSKQSRHQSACLKKMKKKEQVKNVKQKGNAVLASAYCETIVGDDDGYLENILGALNYDYRDVCLQDPALIKVGYLLYQSSKPRTHYSLRWKLRLLAKLKIHLQKIPGCENKTMTELMTISNFDAICSYVKSVASGESKGKLAAPSTAIVYGEILCDLFKSIESDTLRSEASGPPEMRAKCKKNFKKHNRIKKNF